MKISTTKLSFLSVLLCLCTWTRSTAQAIELKGAGENVSPATKQALGEDWKTWNQDFASSSLSEPLIEIRDLPAALKNHQWARSHDTTIEISSLLPRRDFLPVLRHELAHVFLNRLCGKLPVLTDEGAALWLSKDYERLNEQNEQFTYSHDAVQWLTSQTQNQLASSEKLEAALSRLLAISDKRDTYANYFSNLFSACRASQNIEEQASDFGRLLFKSPDPTGKARLDFAFMDGFSHELVATEGHIEKSYPPGSVIKPLFVAAVPSFLNSQTSRDNPSWNCPRPQRPGTLWKWENALTKSCNGFFLDHNLSVEDQSKLKTLFKNANWGEAPSSVKEALGFTGNYELSLKKMISIYDWISNTKSSVTEALLGTPKDGTLSQLLESEWFIQNKIALKSGTIRDQASLPLHMWITAIGPISNGRPSFIAVIHGENIGRKALLHDFSLRLKKYASLRLKPANIEILGLASESTITISCPDKSSILETVNANGDGRFIKGFLKYDQLKLGAKYRCLAQPLKIGWEGRGGISTQRNYWGELSKQELSANSKSHSLSATEKQARARRGSGLHLETSLRHYITNVVYSEFPRGRTETLKALALVVESNLETGHHLDHGVCDTTHCQVFGESFSKNPSWKRISKIVDALPQTNLAPRWREFSPGGNLPWQVSISPIDLKKSLAISEPVEQIVRVGSSVQVRGGEGRLNIPCEDLRTRLRLLSCPDKAFYKDDYWVFTGLGEGHGRGLNLEAADSLAAQGKFYKDLLKEYFP